MQTVRIYLPYGAHLRFEGVTGFLNLGDCITFSYQRKDAKGFMVPGQASADFFKAVICGFSVENEA